MFIPPMNSEGWAGWKTDLLISKSRWLEKITEVDFYFLNLDLHLCCIVNIFHVYSKVEYLKKL